MAKEYNKEEFQKEIIQGSKIKPALVDFYATWCGPCKLQSPIIDELAEKIGDKAIIGKVNVDEQSDIASQYEVMSIPTLIIFKDGAPAKTLVGLNSKESIMAVLEKYF